MTELVGELLAEEVKTGARGAGEETSVFGCLGFLGLTKFRGVDSERSFFVDVGATHGDCDGEGGDKHHGDVEGLETDSERGDGYDCETSGAYEDGLYQTVQVTNGGWERLEDWVVVVEGFETDEVDPVEHEKHE